MIDARIAISALAALALTACAPGGDRDDKQDVPIGYELAMLESGPDKVVEAPSAVLDVSVEELAAKLEAGNIRLIDVRRSEEVAEGIIPGAEHIALDEFDPAQLDLSDGREVVLYCRSGRRSGIAGERLAAHTRGTAQHLAGGINAWQAAGEPTETP